MPNPDPSNTTSGPGKILHVFSCRHSLQLISRSLDEKLPSSQRILLHLHLLLCRLCRRYRRQLLTLRTALPEMAATPAPTPEKPLSQDVKDRMRSFLEKEKEKEKDS